MAVAPRKIVRILTGMNIGGPAIHAALLSAGLGPRGFLTCVVVGEPDGPEGDLSGEIRGEGIRLIRLKSLRRSIRPLADLLTLARLLVILWQERPHIIHTHMAKAGALGRLAGLLYNTVGPGRRTGKRAFLVHTFHGHVLEGYFSPSLTRVFVAVERWLASRTDCLIAVSPSIQRELLRMGLGRVDQWRVVPLGLDLSGLSQLPLPNGSSVVRVGMVGRLVPIKNPALFLNALHRTVRADASASPVWGVVVGDGPMRSALEREAIELGLGNRVRFTGWQRDLLSIYGQLEAACLTSWNEGTPVALIEAMAAGRAVIATRVGGVQDLLEDHPDAAEMIPTGQFHIGDRGVLVRAGDVEGLAKAITAVAEDRALRDRLGQAARTYVLERFAHERLVQDMAELYDRVGAKESR